MSQLQMSRACPVPPFVPSRAQSFAGREEVAGLGVDAHEGVGDEVVPVEDAGRPVGVGQVEEQLGVLDRLGDVLRGQGEGAVVAPPPAPGALEVVLLAPGHVEDHEGHLVHGRFGDRLLHQGDALPAAAGPRPGPGRPGPEGHVAASISLAAFMHTPPTAGICLAKLSSRGVKGSIG